MTTELENFSDEPIQDAEDITHMVTRLGAVKLLLERAETEYNAFLTDPNKFEDVNVLYGGIYVNSDPLKGLLRPSAFARALESRRIVSEFVKVDIDQVIDAIPSSPVGKCKRIQIKVETEEQTFKYATIKDRFYMPPPTRMVLESGNDLLHQTALTMWGLTDSQRKFIRSYDLVEPDPLRTKKRLWVSIMRAAVSSVQLTGLNPKEWVDPKIIAIHRQQGGQASAAMITHILETR